MPPVGEMPVVAPAPVVRQGTTPHSRSLGGEGVEDGFGVVEGERAGDRAELHDDEVVGGVDGDDVPSDPDGVGDPRATGVDIVDVVERAGSPAAPSPSLSEHPTTTPPTSSTADTSRTPGR